MTTPPAPEPTYDAQGRIVDLNSGTDTSGPSVESMDGTSTLVNGGKTFNLADAYKIVSDSGKFKITQLYPVKNSGWTPPSGVPSWAAGPFAGVHQFPNLQDQREFPFDLAQLIRIAINFGRALMDAADTALDNFVDTWVEPILAWVKQLIDSFFGWLRNGLGIDLDPLIDWCTTLYHDTITLLFEITGVDFTSFRTSIDSVVHGIDGFIDGLDMTSMDTLVPSLLNGIYDYIAGYDTAGVAALVKQYWESAWATFPMMVVESIRVAVDYAIGFWVTPILGWLRTELSALIGWINTGLGINLQPYLDYVTQVSNDFLALLKDLTGYDFSSVQAFVDSGLDKVESIVSALDFTSWLGFFKSIVELLQGWWLGLFDESGWATWAHTVWGDFKRLIGEQLHIPPELVDRTFDDFHDVIYPFLHVFTATPVEWLAAWNAFLDLFEVIPLDLDAFWEGTFNLIFQVLNLPAPDWTAVNADLKIIRHPFLHLAEATVDDWVAAWNAAVDLWYQLSIINIGFWHGVFDIILAKIGLPAPNWDVIDNLLWTIWQPFKTARPTAAQWATSLTTTSDLFRELGLSFPMDWFDPSVIPGLPDLSNLQDLLQQLATAPIDIGRLFQGSHGLITDGGFDLRPPGLAAAGDWFWDNTDGRTVNGCAGIVLDGGPHELIGQPISVTVGQQFTFEVYYKPNSVIGGLVELSVIEYKDQDLVGQTTVASQTVNGSSGTWSAKISGGQHVVSTGATSICPSIRVSGASGTIRFDDASTGGDIAHLLLEWIGLGDGSLKDLFDLLNEAGALYVNPQTTLAQWQDWSTRLYTTLGFPDLIATPLGNATGFLLYAILRPVAMIMHAINGFIAGGGGAKSTAAQWGGLLSTLFSSLGFSDAASIASNLTGMWSKFITPLTDVLIAAGELVVEFFTFLPTNTYISRLSGKFNTLLDKLTVLFTGQSMTFTRPSTAGAVAGVLNAFSPPLARLVDLVNHFMTIGDLLTRKSGESDTAWEVRWKTWLVEVFTDIGVPAGVAGTAGGWLAHVVFTLVLPLLNLLDLFATIPTTPDRAAWTTWLSNLFGLLKLPAGVASIVTNLVTMWFDVLQPVLDLFDLIKQLETIAWRNGRTDAQWGSAWAVWISTVLIDVFHLSPSIAAGIANFVTNLWFSSVQPLIDLMTALAQIFSNQNPATIIANLPVTLANVGTALKSWWDGTLGPPKINLSATQAASAAASAQSTANTAQTTANTAQSTASGAAGTAGTALTTAGTATTNLLTLAQNIGGVPGQDIGQALGSARNRVAKLLVNNGSMNASDITSWNVMPNNVIPQAGINGLTTVLGTLNSAIATITSPASIGSFINQVLQQSFRSLDTIFPNWGSTIGTWTIPTRATVLNLFNTANTNIRNSLGLSAAQMPNIV